MDVERWRALVPAFCCCFELRMSFLRFTSAVFRNPLLFRQVLLARAIIGHGYATQKAKTAEALVPKRPPNAYMMYMKENRPSAVEEYPDKTPRDIMLVLSVKWKSLSEDQKKPYKDAYAEKMKSYNAPLVKVPKKPPATFGLFVKEKYPIFEGENPGAKTTEIMAKIASEWNSLPDEEKEEWTEKREKLVQHYKEQVMSFGKGLTPEERAFIDKKLGAQLQKLRKEQRKLLGYPARPLTAFLIFTQKHTDDMKDLPVTERTKIFGKKWREMSVEGKEEYFEESRKAREKYREDVAEWMKKNPEVL